MAGLITVGALVAAGGADAKAGDLLETFGTPGTFTWTVPSGVEQVEFSVYGAAGGAGGGSQAFNGLPPTDPGGRGGQATATFNVKAGQMFRFTVGGKGEDFCLVFNSPDGQGCTRVGGGFNGGLPAFAAGGGGGGGASDVRAGTCTLLTTCPFSTRIVVAGGGGGGGDTTRNTALTCPGGNGGGIAGEAGACSGGAGGTPTESGGQCTGGSGGFGGGGGGGWCLGSGGPSSTPDGVAFAAGGGGSSWVEAPWAVGPITLIAGTGVPGGNGKIVVTSVK